MMRIGKCSRCGESGELYQTGYCRGCHRQYQREYYRRNKERLRPVRNAYQREYRRRVREELQGEGMTLLQTAMNPKFDPVGDKGFTCRGCGRAAIRRRAGQEYCCRPKCQDKERSVYGGYSIDLVRARRKRLQKGGEG